MTKERQIARAIKRIEGRLSDIEEERDPESVIQVLRQPDEPQVVIVDDEGVSIDVDDSADGTFDEDDFDLTEYA